MDKNKNNDGVRSPKGYEHVSSLEDPPKKETGEVQTPEEALHDVLHGEEVIHRDRFHNLKEFYKKHKKWFWIGGAIVLSLIILLVIWAVLSGRTGDFTGHRVVFEASATSAVASGEEVEYTFSYLNDEGVDLRNPIITLSYPDGFEVISVSEEAETKENNVWKLGTLQPGEGGQILVKGRLVGEPDTVKVVAGEFEYKPAGISSSFKEEASADTVINPSGVLVEVNGPQSVASGNDIQYEVSYENSSKDFLKNVQIRLTYPNGFSFSESSPEPLEETNRWRVGELEPSAGGSITVKGTLSGEKGEYKTVKAELGTVDKDGNFTMLASDEDSTKISEVQIAVEALVEDQASYVVEPGKTLDFIVKYKNNSSATLHSVRVEAVIDRRAIDLTSLDIRGGSYSNGVITWDSSGVEELSVLNPGESGELEFTVAVPSIIPVKKISDKNFKVSLVPYLASEDIPVSISQDRRVEGSSAIARVSTEPTIEQLARYYSDSGKKVGNGPTPPKVGQTTTYRIYWRVSNLTNDIKDGIASATLEPGVTFAGGTDTSVGSLRFDSSKKTVIWDIGLIPANVGYVGKYIEASFLVSITPDANLKGEKVPLMKVSTVGGTDAFTRQTVSGEADEVDTSLKGDPKAEGSGKVR